MTTRASSSSAAMTWLFQCRSSFSDGLPELVRGRGRRRCRRRCRVLLRWSIGADAILAAVAHLAPEDQAELTVSTAHQAKGWDCEQVKIADDFAPPSDGPPDDTGQGTARRIDDKEACLAYVVVSRTRRRLDIGGLSWINEHPQGASAGPQPPQ